MRAAEALSVPFAGDECLQEDHHADPNLDGKVV